LVRCELFLEFYVELTIPAEQGVVDLVKEVFLDRNATVRHDFLRLGLSIVKVLEQVLNNIINEDIDVVHLNITKEIELTILNKLLLEMVAT